MIQPKLLKVTHETTEQVLLLPILFDDKRELAEISLDIIAIHCKPDEKDGYPYYQTQKETIEFESLTTLESFVRNYSTESADAFAENYTFEE